MKRKPTSDKNSVTITVKTKRLKWIIETLRNASEEEDAVYLERKLDSAHSKVQEQGC